MKKRILFAFAIITVFALAIAAFAYTRTSISATDDKPSCCKNHDSCPMKGKSEHKGGEHAGGEHHNCCRDSCPMKGKDGSAKAGDHNCCGDSCPMKKKDSDAATAVAVSAEDKKSCCDDCECCKGKHA